MRKLPTLLLPVFLFGLAAHTSAEPAAPAPIRVAIYDDAGGGGAGPKNVEKCLGGAAASEFGFRRVTAKEIRDGVLKEVDVLVQPGGSGSKQAAALEAAGCEAIRAFVRDGGGYVGICAGAYLATTNYTWSLGLLNAKVLDTKHWARGTGTVRIRLSAEGRELLGSADEIVSVYYGQGPLLAPDTKAYLPAYRPLAVYETEIAKNGAPEGVMKGTTAIAAAEFGKGYVVCISPHPEKSEALEDYVRRAVRWAHSGAVEAVTASVGGR